MKHFLALLISVTSVYLIKADEKGKELVVIEYSDHTEDHVIINENIKDKPDEIWKVIEPIINAKENE